VKFSQRIDGELRPNALTLLLEEKKRLGIEILDLTESNPTRAGIRYPHGFLAALADEKALHYEPEPFGMPAARETLAREYSAPWNRVVLTASTSEAYSWLFKLLCDPGDEVLIPRPSYPLFEYLAALEGVTVTPYGLFYDHGWFVDLHTVERAISGRTRAIVVVNPNNPTGNFLKAHELEALMGFGLPIISDEVFRDYAFGTVDQTTVAPPVPLFRLNGLSKTVGLPQMKLAWIIAEGPDLLVDAALARLEIIADTYLSVGTPVQCALASLLALRAGVQNQIRKRTRANLEFLRDSPLRVLDVEGGWYAVVSLEEDAPMRLLRDYNVLVQPGYFYDFEQSGFIVLSLLTLPETFREGVRRAQNLLPPMAQ
jgi:aspartate/methionine/tyrosine aminotransferase